MSKHPRIKHECDKIIKETMRLMHSGLCRDAVTCSNIKGPVVFPMSLKALSALMRIFL